MVSTHICTYLKPSYFSSTLILAIFVRQGFSIFVLVVLLKIVKILLLHTISTGNCKILMCILNLVINRPLTKITKISIPLK